MRNSNNNIVYVIEGLRVGKNFKRLLQKFVEYKVATSCHRDILLNPNDPDARTTFSFSFSPDGSKVASSHGDHHVKVFDLGTEKRVNILKGHPRTAWSLAFHPYHNNILATGCLAGQIRVWDLRNETCQLHEITDGKVVASLAFHPTDDDILVAASACNIFMLDWRNGSLLCSFHSSERKIRSLKFDPLGTWMIIAVENSFQSRNILETTDRGMVFRSADLLPVEGDRFHTFRLHFCDLNSQAEPLDLTELNSVPSVSISPLNGYLLIGMGNYLNFYNTFSEDRHRQTAGKVFKLPDKFKRIGSSDELKMVIYHPDMDYARNYVRLNSMKFHPTPGVGILYGNTIGHLTFFKVR
eukprot:gene16060-17683_t